MENACCNDSSDATFDYFANREKSIVPDNEMRDIRSALDDLGRMAKAPILFDPEDTRQIYPKIPAEFDKETIYRAFIVYCKYNSEIPISEELRAICMEKPTILMLMHLSKNTSECLNAMVETMIMKA